MWPMGDQGRREEPCAQETQLGPRNPNMDRQGPVSQEESLRFKGRDSICPISRKGRKAKAQKMGRGGLWLLALTAERGLHPQLA